MYDPLSLHIARALKALSIALTAEKRSEVLRALSEAIEAQQRLIESISSQVVSEIDKGERA